MLGKIEGMRRWQKMRWLDGIFNSMVWWHLQLNAHEFEQTPGDSEGQGSLMCCSPWGLKESVTTERLNNNPSLLPSPTKGDFSLFPSKLLHPSKVSLLTTLFPCIQLADSTSWHFLRTTFNLQCPLLSSVTGIFLVQTQSPNWPPYATTVLKL